MVCVNQLHQYFLKTIWIIYIFKVKNNYIGIQYINIIYNTIGKFKRPLTVSTSGPSSSTLSSPMSPKIPESSIPMLKKIKGNQKTKIPKIRSPSNSSARIDTYIKETLDPARDTLRVSKTFLDQTRLPEQYRTKYIRHKKKHHHKNILDTKSY